MNFSSYSRINTIVGWVVLIIALLTYTLTQEATVSLWDCGEFVPASYKLEVVHPPGAPFFLMLNHFFTLFAGGNEAFVPDTVNFSSSLMSALASLFLFWTITAIAGKIAFRNENDIKTDQLIIVIIAGLIGSLGYTWSDTAWFSAVEGEVYAMSSMFIALVSWLMMKWERRADEPDNMRWIVFICFCIGLSSGVHLMALLAIPAMALVFTFKKFGFTIKRFLIVSVIGLILLGLIQVGIIIGIPAMISKFELLFVNSFGMPFWTGAFVFLITLIAVLIFGIYSTQNVSGKPEGIGQKVGILMSVLIALITFGVMGFASIVWFGLIPLMTYFFKQNPLKARIYSNVALTSIAVILIGYSSYTMVVIRSLANPAIDMNDPENVFSLLSYLNREQYGDRPIVKGPNFTAYETGSFEVEKTGDKEYRKGKEGYEFVGRKVEETITNPKHETLFPRMYSRQDDHISGYNSWVRMRKGKIPSLGNNLAFFFKYQLNHMWFRYFGWNFIGRQNDEQGHGDKFRGNISTGLNGLDQSLFGVPDDSQMPDHRKADKSRNLLFGIPFLLGMIGLFFHATRNQESFLYVLMYFIMTGIALAVYLNMPPYQPRERDYVFVASFYFYFIWVALGAVAIWNFLRDKVNPTLAAVGVGGLVLLVVPVNMVAKEWDDHDRSNRTVPLAFGTNYLESCDSNAILFTNGDNDTYPLWYAQEVEGIRDDIRIINLSLLNTDWYINQMRRPINSADSIHMTMFPKQYIQGTRDYATYYDQHGLKIDKEKRQELRKLLAFVASNKKETKVRLQNGEMLDFFPTKKLKITVDKAAALKNGAVTPDKADQIVDQIEWKIRKNTLMKADLVVLDVIATNAANGWKRPIYWAITTGTDAYLNLMPYLQMEGLTYRLVPIRKSERSQSGEVGTVHSDLMYTNIMEKFDWGGLDTEEDMWVDFVMMRQCRNFRNVFIRLSQSLYVDAQMMKGGGFGQGFGAPDLEVDKTAISDLEQKAIEVLDKGLASIPERHVAYDFQTAQYSNMYYALGEVDKAYELDKRIAEYLVQDIKWYQSLAANRDRDLQQELQYYIRQNTQSLQNMISNAKEHGKDASPWEEALGN